MAYDFYCEFDIEQHKKKYPHYLEVLIDEQGEVLYAIPSHQEKAIELCCQKLGVSRKQLDDLCPPEYYFDYLKWLLSICNCISVWTDFYYGEPNSRQLATLKKLKLYGVYEGSLR